MAEETSSSFEKEILQRLTRVETKLDLQLNARDTAIEALTNSKQAHTRLDEIISRQSWLWRTVIGAFVVEAVAFFWKGGFVK